MKRKNKAKKLVWLRGYRCHTLWDDKTRLGRITLGEPPERRGIYLCEAGTRQHEATSLEAAKRWVLENVLHSRLQGLLF